MPSIFVCHSSHDKPLARRLTIALREHGATVWIDEAELDVGDSLIARLADAVYRCDFVAALISSSSVRSKWVQKELQLAMTREIEGQRIRVLPILVGACKDEIPFFLRDKLYADFSVTNAYESALARLLRAIDKVPTITDSGALNEPREDLGDLNVGAVLHDQGTDFLGFRVVRRKYRIGMQTFALGLLSLFLSLLFTTLSAGTPVRVMVYFSLAVMLYAILTVLTATYMRESFEGDRNLLLELERIGEPLAAFSRTWWKQFEAGSRNVQFKTAKCVEAVAHVTIFGAIIFGIAALVRLLRAWLRL
ncbi:MAG: toll/interleukin-1 receptor domain-containing protein [Candidatus Omnitrophota bacterium]|nr:toll/interleukin-1 receptor domain-containing protein [Candidatus Omnitrophota bacterium]